MLHIIAQANRKRANGKRANNDDGVVKGLMRYYQEEYGKNDGVEDYTPKNEEIIDYTPKNKK